VAEKYLSIGMKNELAAKEIQILSDPTSKLYPIIRLKMLNLFPENMDIQKQLGNLSIQEEIKPNINTEKTPKTIPRKVTTRSQSSPLKLSSSVKGNNNTNSSFVKGGNTMRMLNSSPLSRKVKTYSDQKSASSKPSIYALPKSINSPFKQSNRPLTISSKLNAPDLKKGSHLVESKKAAVNLNQTPISNKPKVKSSTPHVNVQHSPIVSSPNDKQFKISNSPIFNLSPITRQPITIPKSIPKAKKENNENEFYVPKLNTTDGTRSGLRIKKAVSDLEAMRVESDLRLKNAIRKAAMKQKLLDDELKRKKMKRDEGFRGKSDTSFRLKARPKTEAIQKHTSTRHNIDPNKSPVPIKNDSKEIKSTITKLPSKAPTNKNEPQINDLLMNNEQLMNGFLQMLSTKMDPVLQSYQQHWENTSKKIDEKLTIMNNELLKNEIVIKNDEPKEKMNVGKDDEYVSERVYDLNPYYSKSFTIQNFATPSESQSNASVDEIQVHDIEPSIEIIHKVALQPEDRLIIPLDIISVIQEDQEKRVNWSKVYFGYSDYEQPYVAVEMYFGVNNLGLLGI
jgi:hypothetical protein